MIWHARHIFLLLSCLFTITRCLSTFPSNYENLLLRNERPKLHIPNPIGGQDDMVLNATISFDLKQTKPISPTLFGIFFEEIGHAGDGGLYAELVQDRSFDAIAHATGFVNLMPPSHRTHHRDSHSHSFNQARMPVDLQKLALEQSKKHSTVTKSTASSAGPHSSYNVDNQQGHTKHSADYEATTTTTKIDTKAIIVPWMALPGTSTTLTREYPMNENNQVAMELSTSTMHPRNLSSTPASQPRGGISNFGYWGIHVEAGASYEFSIYMMTPMAAYQTSHLKFDFFEVEVALTRADLVTPLGPSIVFQVDHHSTQGGEPATRSNEWKKYTGTFDIVATDSDARLVIRMDPGNTLLIDSLSLFPSANVARGKKEGHLNPWPFRQDLLQALKDLRPGFLRFPGGCYVEGDWMRNAFRWKNSVGRNEERPGHYNLWGYWSTDGLGIFEYMLLVEELRTEPVWVINNGVAHGDSISPRDVLPLLQDVLDSIEFISAPVESGSEWAKLRESMGRTKPWTLNYVAIGNEDCGKPYYVENFNLFYGALKASYPHITLISNCDMEDHAPTEMWDWHVYTNPQSMFDLRHAFDGRDPAAGHFVFASEYAVTDGGGWGNVIGAISEAAFMTGLERNGEAVRMAAYAPLFVHWNDRPWPTNMIVINNHQWFGIPSYYVQRMFRETQGTHYIETIVSAPPSEAPPRQETIAASATCQDPSCTTIVIKIVNFNPQNQILGINVRSGAVAANVDTRAEAVVLASQSDNPQEENSFDDPMRVAPMGAPLDGVSDSFAIQVAPWSLTLMQLHVV